jgi:diacylglycerol kinase (ATP)
MSDETTLSQEASRPALAQQDAQPPEIAAGSILFVVNPVAGSNSGLDLPSLIAEACGAKQPYVLFIPASVDELREKLPQLLESAHIEKVVIAGGDGTVMDAVPLLLPADVLDASQPNGNNDVRKHTSHQQGSAVPSVLRPIGLLPLGTGNLLAQNLGIPTEIHAALQVVLTGKPQAIDVGRINEHLFVLNAGVGIDAEIMAKTERKTKKRWGVFAYVVEGARQVLAPRRAKLNILADGKRIRAKAIGVLCFNVGSQIGGGLHVVPNVEPDDGLLHGSIFRIQGAFDFFLGLFQVLTRKRGQRRDPVQHFLAQHIRIESTPTLKAQADGNVIGETPVTIELLAHKLYFLVPQL